MRISLQWPRVGEQLSPSRMGREGQNFQAKRNVGRGAAGAGGSDGGGGPQGTLQGAGQGGAAGVQLHPPRPEVKLPEDNAAGTLSS